MSLRNFVSQVAPRKLKGMAWLAGVASGAWLAGQPSHAADSSIGVKAEIYTESCRVTSGRDLQIDLGIWLSAELQKIGAASAWVNAPESIELACPDGISSVDARFDGVADSMAANTFRNNGTARNVSIELQLQNGTKLAPGAVQGATVAAGKAAYALRARLYAHRGNATIGTVIATASFTLSYP